MTEDSVTAWRFWIVDPDPRSDGAILGPCRGEPWEARDFVARCPTNPDHQPPVDNCGCGVWAWQNIVDTRLWMRRTQRYGLPPSTPPPPPHFVLGEVVLFDSVERQPKPRHMYDTGRPEGRIVDAPKALAGSRARIESLWVFDDPDWHPLVSALAKQLSMKWDIPVRIGEPDYTVQEWDSKQSDDTLCEEFGLTSPAVRC